MRGRSKAAALCAVLWWMGGCESEPRAADERTRRVRQEMARKPVDIEAKKKSLFERSRIYDEDKALLPSDDVVAGIRLPRGLTEKLHVENRYYFHTSAPLSKLREYFGPRLTTAEINPLPHETFEYVRATTKDADPPHRVTVRIGPSAQHPQTHEVRIEDHSTGRVSPPRTFAETQAQLRALQEHAD